MYGDLMYACIYVWRFDRWVTGAKTKRIDFTWCYEDRTKDIKAGGECVVELHLEKVENENNTLSFQYLNLRHIYFWIRGLPGRHGARMLLNGHTWKMSKCITKTEMKWFCRYFTEESSSTYRLDFQ